MLFYMMSIPVTFRDIHCHLLDVEIKLNNARRVLPLVSCVHAYPNNRASYYPLYPLIICSMSYWTKLHSLCNIM